MVIVQISCSYGNLRYPHPHQQPRQVRIYIILYRERVDLWLSLETPHTKHHFLYLNEDSHFYTRRLLTGVVVKIDPIQVATRVPPSNPPKYIRALLRSSCCYRPSPDPFAPRLPRSEDFSFEWSKSSNSSPSISAYGSPTYFSSRS